MGGSSSDTQTQQYQQTDPWGPQARDLRTLLSDSNSALKQSQSVQPYTGDFVQGVSADGQAAMNNALYNTANGATSAVNSLYNGGNYSLANGLGGATSAMNGLGNYANTNQTANTIANANQYMNQNVISGQVQAGMQDVNNNFNENIMPGINAQAAGQGGMLGSRAGIAQGIAERGVNEQAANMASQLEGNAYNTGINAAQAQNQQQLSALSTQGSLGSSLASTGAYDLASGVNSNATNANTLNTINNANIGYGQDQLANAIDKQNYQVTQPFQSLDLYNSLVNGRSMGSVTSGYGNSETETNPSLLSTAGSGLGALGGMSCDERIKTDIKRIGTFDGSSLGMFSFRYKDDPSRKVYIGPIAQEVQSVDPSLVYTDDGILKIKAEAFVSKLIEGHLVG